MVKHKWLILTRNKLADIYAQLNSAAAIEGARMTESEREYVKTRLAEIVKFIDSRT